ncbi:R3H domain-containing nucleic acid-binding protein [Synechocystis sp. LKSZ1]|uniref:Jag family protein n=1 Tax=Synechocystis sp. LKSZ1 TaxID=3144951 RepID=UPI00336BD77C
MTLANPSQSGQVWLETLLTLMGMPATITAEDKQDAVLTQGMWLMIDPQALNPLQIKGLMGERGEGLDALQYLLNATLNRSPDGESLENSALISVDMADYRQQRQSQLLEWSQQAATQVRSTQQPVEMPALSAAERRLIHTFFEKEADLVTESQGQEPDRRLIVRPRTAPPPLQVFFD